MNPLEIIRSMPKVELHLHLEGAFTLESLYRLINKYGGDPDVKNLEDLKRKFIFTDFHHFIETWYWKSKYYREAADIEDMAYSTILDLSQKNIIYAEVFFSPWDFVKPEMPFKSVTEAVISGVRRAESECPIRIGLIADLIRDQGYQTVDKRLDEITPYRNEVIGVGLGGSEKEFPAEWFTEVFHEAKRRGFHVVAHAGEVAGADSIWSALKNLQAERIGHGVRATEDPALIDYLKSKQIPLEVCVNSNLKLKIFSTPADHPVRRFFDEGLLVTINSDDPTMFGMDLNDEFILLFNEYKFTLPEIRQLTSNAIRASFANDRYKAHLTQAHEKYWKQITLLNGRI
ncbi:MAG: adenosine deaminase [Candidatus Marinimicrobia bacterium]|nr:adenosine deaminase [Candidatus Neomarinimicrobiota bacterium]